MFSNKLKHILNKTITKSSSLKSYIHAIEESKYHHWTFNFKINIIQKKNASEITYGYKTFAKHYGDWVIFNEGYLFTTPEEALGAITSQVFDVSDNTNINYVILRDERNGANTIFDYKIWYFDIKQWKKISKNEYINYD